MNGYTVWANNNSGASVTVASNVNSIRKAEQAARNELGSGWTVHITDAQGQEVKSFRIR